MKRCDLCDRSSLRPFFGANPHDFGGCRSEGSGRSDPLHHGAWLTLEGIARRSFGNKRPNEYLTVSLPSSSSSEVFRKGCASAGSIAPRKGVLSPLFVRAWLQRRPKRASFAHPRHPSRNRIQPELSHGRQRGGRAAPSEKRAALIRRPGRPPPEAAASPVSRPWYREPR